MRYLSVNCDACGKAFDEDSEVVVCPVCGTPEHKECWCETNECINSARHAEGYAWKMPEKTKPHATMFGTPVSEPSGKSEAVPEGFIVCNTCGNTVSAYEPDCPNCGTRLYKDNRQFSAAEKFPAGAYTRDNAGNSNPYDYADEFYRDYHKYDHMTIDGIPAMDYASYIQQNAGKILDKFNDMDVREKSTSWNWAAFFFSFYYLFYRKMYKLGALIMAVTIVTGALTITHETIALSEAMLELNEELLNSETPDPALFLEKLATIYKDYIGTLTISLMIASGVISFAFRIYLGLYTNSIYRKQSSEKIKHLRTSATSQEEFDKNMRVLGGPSILSLLMSMAIYYVLNLMATNLMQMILK